MKRYLLASTLIFAGATQIALAELKIPSSVFEMGELEEAKARAVESEKPLIFVYTNPRTT
ncbi:hypothetical protein BH23VER1_BH23VER1_35420 [soil metagenome]